MASFDDPTLSKRESQIMSLLYRRGACSVAEVRDGLPDAPGYSSVRKLLEILERKGHVSHTVAGQRYVYRARIAAGKAARSALRRLLSTFFEGEPERAVAALLESSEGELTEESLERIEAVIRARREGRE